ncbi:hypothetical protein SI65_00125 [Aspergillus cristatus]|uniref:Zn(2)-C6 fungal-type domain-containing protein n=1 Tax=Aspergillus cristatus TaxID=573508 RepID=A0A1E3BNR7_ASPCR|nr:hypothetical protein SI65_00125 [Aspergillus cristatus]
MPTAKAPCLNCREKHLKCDKQKPTCKRCKTKGLQCIHAPRKINFRHWSTDNFETRFSGDQTWVNSKPRDWKAPVRVGSSSSGLETPAVSGLMDGQSSSQGLFGTSGSVTDLGCVDPLLVPEGEDDRFQAGAVDQAHRICDESTGLEEFNSHIVSPGTLSTLSFPVSSGTSGEDVHFGPPAGSDIGQKNNSEHGVVDCSISCEEKPYFPVHASTQESCLLRYFIEELSPLFDHCDERKHFQLVVPFRAQHCPTLRNALFAVSSRHLVRRPQYMTPQGVLYHDQLLIDLKSSTAVEYMLQCIPGLVRFPEIQDSVEQENIMAAAVILRQYEEIEEDMGDDDEVGMEFREQVNFLAITQTIIDSMISSPLNQSLATAAYWIAIRQEVYYALTRERTLSMRFSPEDWQNASVANTLIMLVGEVAKWCWGEKSPEEWERLNNHQEHLMQTYKAHLIPILSRKADKSKGEIFPTVWYTSDAQVTATQHLELARMILIAESPHLTNAPRSLHRKAESQVRSIVLNVCGIALSHLRCQPALVNAVIAITLYGEYFTEQEEREALVGIVERTRGLRAWPMEKPFLTLKRRWEVADCGGL